MGYAESKGLGTFFEALGSNISEREKEKRQSALALALKKQEAEDELRKEITKNIVQGLRDRDIVQTYTNPNQDIVANAYGTAPANMTIAGRPVGNVGTQAPLIPEAMPNFDVGIVNKMIAGDPSVSDYSLMSVPNEEKRAKTVAETQASLALARMRNEYLDLASRPDKLTKADKAKMAALGAVLGRADAINSAVAGTPTFPAIDESPQPNFPKVNIDPNDPVYIQIQNLRANKTSDNEIRKNLIEAGFDPAKYGL